MKVSKLVSKIQNREKPNDVVHTPLSIVKVMIDLCDLKDGDTVLDPSAGHNKIFYNNFPDFVKKDYCEITEGKDFFEYNEKVDCIIGNPPYSLWSKWLVHTMKITDKFCYIFGALNIGLNRLDKIFKEGFGITKIIACQVNWWFANSLIIVFERNKPSIMGIIPKILCDVCGKTCNRGIKGNSMNVCVPKPIKEKGKNTV